MQRSTGIVSLLLIKTAFWHLQKILHTKKTPHIDWALARRVEQPHMQRQIVKAHKPGKPAGEVKQNREEQKWGEGVGGRQAGKWTGWWVERSVSLTAVVSTKSKPLFWTQFPNRQFCLYRSTKNCAGLEGLPLFLYPEETSRIPPSHIHSQDAAQTFLMWLHWQAGKR